jgi:hypothetical protein
MIQGRMLEAFFAPSPVMTISQTGNALNLAWPLAATGYHIETSTNLVPDAIWMSNATSFIITNGQNVLTTSWTNHSAQLFFRLSQ